MDDIYSSSDINKRPNNKKHNSKQAFEDLFSDSLYEDTYKAKNDEYFKKASEPPRNPRFTEYEDISSGRDEDDDINPLPKFEEVNNHSASDISFSQRLLYHEIYSEEDDDVLTSPFVHGDEDEYTPQQQRTYVDYNTKIQKNSQLKKTPDRKNRKEKKKGKAGKGILTIFLVLVILFGCVFGYVFSLAARLNHENDIGHNNPHISSAELMSDTRVQNILLIGTDAVNNGASRSDTNMLVSIDRNNRKIKLISFMRDYWVEIPDNGNGKLNAACAYGGPGLTVYTIEKNFGIKIDGFAMVDFDIFISIIDALGGIEVEVTEKEASFMRNQVTWTDVQAGSNVLLNGKEALLYCRIRKLDSDFMRTERQRKMITALIKKMASPEVVKILPSLDDVLPQITTNMPSLNLTLTAFGAIPCIGYEIEQMQVPFEGTWDYDTINGQSVLVADREKQKQMLKEYMYN